MNESEQQGGRATVESLRLLDPRKYGQEQKKLRLATQAVSLSKSFGTGRFSQMLGDIQEHLDRREDEELYNALAACPDQGSYGFLFGAIAMAACQWTSFNKDFEMGAHWIFGIQLTMHPEDWEQAGSWTPKEWGPDNNEESLGELLKILQRNGVTAGMERVTVLPNLVDQARLMELEFSRFQGLAVEVVESPKAAASVQVLEHRPWVAGAGAQARALVLGGRCESLPRGMVSDNPKCTDELIRWSNRWFGAGSGMVPIASSPELLLSLITGKGQHMVNCARLATLLQTPVEISGSPLLDLSAVPKSASHGALEFRMGKAGCVWDLHGRNEWEEARQSLSVMLPRSSVGARFARVQLGLNGEQRWDGG